MKIHCCFNGAADVHPRKLVRHKLLRGQLAASMGPRMFIRGNVVAQVVARSDLIGFNGAADVHPRKLNLAAMVS